MSVFMEYKFNFEDKDVRCNVCEKVQEGGGYMEYGEDLAMCGKCLKRIAIIAEVSKIADIGREVL